MATSAFLTLELIPVAYTYWRYSQLSARRLVGGHNGMVRALCSAKLNEPILLEVAWMFNELKLRSLFVAAAMVASASACGGQSQPKPEAPEPLPAAPGPTSEPTPPEGADAGGAGEHTMPDGTKMSGQH
ncbi:MAG: hypothetical protein HYZ29_33135 [Myxococcales bacterium]|nr:hypothetical protein [Myxococcales bacterium]